MRAAVQLPPTNESHEEVQDEGDEEEQQGNDLAAAAGAAVAMASFPRPAPGPEASADASLGRDPAASSALGPMPPNLDMAPVLISGGVGRRHRNQLSQQLDDLRRWVSMLLVNVSDIRVKDLRLEDLQRIQRGFFALYR